MTLYEPPLLARIPPPIWALLYLAVAFGIDTFVLDLHIQALRHPLVGGLIAGVSLILALSAAFTFKRAGTQISPSAPVNARLVEHGPYGLTRNPMYLSLVLLTTGIAFKFGAPVLFLVPVIIYLTNDRIVVPYEEHKMEAQYGDTYRSYMNRVRRWI